MMSKTDHISCSSRGKGLQKMAPHKRILRTKTNPELTISSDSMGPITHPSMLGNQYVITFVDAATWFCIPVLIKCRSEASNIIPGMLQPKANHFSRYQRRSHSDNAKEFVSSIVKSYLDYHRIQQSTTAPHHPQKNSVAERLNRNIMNAARAAIPHSRLPPSCWKFAVMASKTTCHSTRRTASQ